MEKIINEIKTERQKQNEKWGEQNHNPVEWMAILTEEVGEASKEAVEAHFTNTIASSNESLKKYREELIQVAAVAVQMIECLDRNRK